MNMDDVVKLGGVPTWYGPDMVGITISDFEAYNFYGADQFIDGPHNHYADFHSEVLQGEMRNRIYHVTPKEGGEWTEYHGDCVNVCDASSNFCCNFKIIHPEVELTQYMHWEIQGGSSYSIQRDLVHSVDTITPNVITHLKRGATRKGPTSVYRRRDRGECILGLGSGRIGAPATHTPSEDEMWAVIEKVVENK